MVPAPPRGDRLVLGPVPPLARVAGVLLVLAGLAGLVAPFPTYLVVGDVPLVLGGDPVAVLAALLVPLVHLAVGAGLAAGRLPKLGLAYAVLNGALAVGLLLIELYRGRSSTARSAVEVLGGQLVVTSGVRIGVGWVLLVASLGLALLAAAVAVAAWGRTVMEDDGSFDAHRGGVAVASGFLGLAAVLSLMLPAADVPDDLVVDPLNPFKRIVVPRLGPPGLLERPSLALLGGLLLAGAILLGSVAAPSLRPRLAAVGGLLGITGPVLAAGLTGWQDAAGSDGLYWTVAGIGLLLCGLGYLGLTLLTWRLRPAPARRE